MKQNKKSILDKAYWLKFIGKDTKIIFSLITISAIVCISLILLALFSAPGGPSAVYRPCGSIVITSDSKNPDGFVSSTLERCRYFLIYDLGTKRYKSFTNPYFNKMNPGAEAARFIANKAEEAVISGNIGQEAYQTLDNFSVQVYLVHKTTVRQAVELFLQGKLIHVQLANQPNQMNAGMGAQRAAWTNPVFAQQPLASPRTAFCPMCRLNMPIGAHIQTNRIMCPYCPGQNMQIMGQDFNQMQMPSQQAQAPTQQVAFWPGNNNAPNGTSRGVCVLR